LKAIKDYHQVYRIGIRLERNKIFWPQRKHQSMFGGCHLTKGIKDFLIESRGERGWGEGGLSGTTHHPELLKISAGGGSWVNKGRGGGGRVS